MKFRLFNTSVCLMALAGSALAAPCDTRPDLFTVGYHDYAAKRALSFRALSGVRNPVVPEAQPVEEYLRWQATSPEEQKLLQQLFPDPAQSGNFGRYGSPQFGACRIEGPVMQFKARLARLGANHPYMHQWIVAERIVMGSCANPNDRVLPDPLQSSDPAIMKLQAQDRAYQQAAMLFYGGNDDQALAAFQKIADDRSSPNRPLATYMVLTISEARFNGPGADIGPTQVLEKINTALADPSLKEIHVMARNLIGYMGATYGDEPTRRAQVRDALSALELPAQEIETDPQATTRFSQALSNINFLRSRFPDAAWIVNGNVPRDYHASLAMVEGAKTDPMAAWIGFPEDPFELGSWAVEENAKTPAPLLRYLDTHRGEAIANPWVHVDPRTSIATLTRLVDEESGRLKACPSDVQARVAMSYDYPTLVRKLLMAGDAAHETQALQLMVRLSRRDTGGFGRPVAQSLDYLVAKGRLTAARRLRDQLKMDSDFKTVGLKGYVVKGPPIDSVGALMLLAENEDRLARVVGNNYYLVDLLNPVSSALLWKLAARADVSTENRALFARTAWTRDYALGRVIPASHDRLMRERNVEMTRGWRAPLGKDVNPDDVLVLQDVLASPGLNMVMTYTSRTLVKKDMDNPGPTGIDHYNHNDGNWWCAWESDLRQRDVDNALSSRFGWSRDAEGNDHTVPVRAMLQPAMRASFLFRNIDQGELRALSKVGCAPRSLGRKTIAWVRGTGWFGSREGQAAALAAVVSATRWGCNRQGGHKAYSGQAYNLLHTLFPDTQAARNTPYWFD